MAIKGLQITSARVDVTGGPNLTDTFVVIGYDQQSRASSTPGFVATFQVMPLTFRNEDAFDTEKSPMLQFGGVYYLDLTQASLDGATLRDDIYTALKSALEAEGHTVTVVNK
mgnify:CR=1 FL=1